MNDQRSLLRKLFDYVKAIFFDGLLVILPAAFTIALFNIVFRILKRWLEPIYRLEPFYLQRIPHFEFIIVLLFILLVGAIFRIFFLKMFLEFAESMLYKIPLLKPIYLGIKQLIKAFTLPGTAAFTKVVFVEFPYPGSYSIGFVTSQVPEELTPQMGTKFYKVFIPIAPNPTHGFLVAVAQDRMITTTLTRQEAMTLIISGGIIQPDRFTQK